MKYIFQIFNYNGHKVRLTNKDNDIWFVLEDIAYILHIKDIFDAATLIEANDKVFIRVDDKEFFVINVFGVFTLCQYVNRKTSKPFKSWLFKYVLPVARNDINYSDNHQQIISNSQEQEKSIINEQLKETEQTKANNSLLHELGHYSFHIPNKLIRLYFKEQQINLEKARILLTLLENFSHIMEDECIADFVAEIFTIITGKDFIFNRAREDEEDGDDSDDDFGLPSIE